MTDRADEYLFADDNPAVVVRHRDAISVFVNNAGKIAVAREASVDIQIVEIDVCDAKAVAEAIIATAKAATGV